MCVSITKAHRGIVHSLSSSLCIIIIYFVSLKLFYLKFGDSAVLVHVKNCVQLFLPFTW